MIGNVSPRNDRHRRRPFLATLLSTMGSSPSLIAAACLLILATAGVVALLTMPVVLRVVRKQVEGHRQRQFVAHLQRPGQEISDTFYADLNALREFLLVSSEENAIDHQGSNKNKNKNNKNKNKNNKNKNNNKKMKKRWVKKMIQTKYADNIENEKVGIVVPCGNSRSMLRNLYTGLAALRDGLRSSMPVTVSYYGSREPIGEAVQEVFTARFSNVTFMDLSAEFEYPAHQRGIDNENTAYFGFKAKILALYASPYQHVLLLDSDSVPLIDPALLFASEAYAKHGNVFWPDRWCEPVPLFDELIRGGNNDSNNNNNNNDDDTPDNFRQTDSGQVLLDRRRHQDVLEYLLFLNAHDEFTYGLAYGDKDTFEAAFLLAGKRDAFYQVRAGPSIGLSGATSGSKPLGFFHVGLDEDVDSKDIAFVHRTSEAKRASPARVAWVLWHTDCAWNERYWQFFRPLTWGGSKTWEACDDGGDGGGGLPGGAAWGAAEGGWEEAGPVLDGFFL